MLVFALGLPMTVAPLTATVLADADESNAGIASGVNNAIARVSALVAIAAIAVVAAQFLPEPDSKLGALATARIWRPSSPKRDGKPLARVRRRIRPRRSARGWPGPRRSPRYTRSGSASACRRC